MRVNVILSWIAILFSASMPLHVRAEHAFRINTDFPGGSAEILGVDPSTATIHIQPAVQWELGFPGSISSRENMCIWNSTIRHACSKMGSARIRSASDTVVKSEYWVWPRAASSLRFPGAKRERSVRRRKRSTNSRPQTTVNKQQRKLCRVAPKLSA